MNSLISSLVATGLTAAVALTVFGLPDFGPGVAEDEITGSIAPSGRNIFTLESEGFRCNVRRGARIAPTVYRLEAAERCKSIFGRSADVVYWTETSRGGIVISDKKGVIAEFANADGAQLESIYPSRPLFTLTRSAN